MTLRLTPHVMAPAVFLDALRALRALPGPLLDRRQACIFFLDMLLVLDARLELLASLVLVPGPVARDAGSGAAVVAGADVWLGWLDLRLSRSFRFRFDLCRFGRLSGVPTKPKADDGSFLLWLVCFLLEVFDLRRRLFLLLDALVYLPGPTSRRKTPAPSRCVLADVPPLKLVVPVKH